MIGTKKKRNRTVEVADPDLRGAGVEVEGAFFVDFAWSVRWGQDLDADGRGRRKRGCWIKSKPAFLSLCEQDDIGDSDLAIASEYGLLVYSQVSVSQTIDEVSDGESAAAMVEARGWRHDELAARVDLEAFRPIGEGRIVTYFEPALSGRSYGKGSHGIACGKSGQRREVET
jgi:hypothetical protein